MKKKIILSTSSDQTFQLGENIGKKLHGGEILLLHGDLGSGKTTFSQGVARGLGVTGRVTSPTFLIIRSYSLSADISLQTLYHIDAYRLSDVREADGLGLQDIFRDQKAIVLCEWPERIAELLPAKRKNVYFTYVDDEMRKIEIEE